MSAFCLEVCAGREGEGEAKPKAFRRISDVVALHSTTKCKRTSVQLSVSNERKHWALHPQKPLRLIRDGKVGGSGILYLAPTRYTVTTRMILH